MVNYHSCSLLPSCWAFLFSSPKLRSTLFPAPHLRGIPFYCDMDPHAGLNTLRWVNAPFLCSPASSNLTVWIGWWSWLARGIFKSLETQAEENKERCKQDSGRWDVDRNAGNKSGFLWPRGSVRILTWGYWSYVLTNNLSIILSVSRSYEWKMKSK